MKKQFITLLLSACLIISASSCAPAVETVTDVEFDWGSAASISFEKLLKESSEAHMHESLDTEALTDFENYLVTGEEYKNLLTDEELEMLQVYRSPNNDIIPKSAFEEDVSLLFRYLKSFYGAYFYFGGTKVFDKVENDIYKLIKDFDPDVPGDELINVFNDYLAFIQDRNFEVMRTPIIIQNKDTYDYYYCSLYFSKDEIGYYTISGDEKWYYDTCRNADVTIHPVLTPDGDIKYSPVLLHPSRRVRIDDKVKLICGDKQTETEFSWKKGALSEPEGFGEDFDFAESDGVSYIRPKYLSSDFKKSIEETAHKVKDSKLIIYDLRESEGNSDDSARSWTAKYTGEAPQLNGCTAARKDGTFEFTRTEGTFSENDIPIIILVDNYTCEAGEMAMLYAKTIESAIVIGSNTTGTQLSSQIQRIYLPNSGVELSVPSSIKLCTTMDNIDGVGYLPDIWCPSEHILDAVSNLLAKEDYAEPDIMKRLKSVNSISSTSNAGNSGSASSSAGNSGKPSKGNRIIDTVIQYGSESIENIAGLDEMIDVAMSSGKGSKMVVVYDSYVIGENDPFGGENFDDSLVFFLGKEKISGYTLTFDNPDVATVTYNENGSVHIKLPTQGNWPFVVNYNGETYRFILAV